MYFSRFCHYAHFRSAVDSSVDEHTLIGQEELCFLDSPSAGAPCVETPLDAF